jgi:hypothetical protein
MVDDLVEPGDQLVELLALLGNPGIKRSIGKRLADPVLQARDGDGKTELLLVKNLADLAQFRHRFPPRPVAYVHFGIPLSRSRRRGH